MSYNFGIRNSDNIIKVIKNHMYIDMTPLLIIFCRNFERRQTKSSYKWDSKADDVVIQTLKKLGKL